MGKIDRKYGSHMPLLMRIMELTHGDVLELGMGLYSSPMLDMMCELQGRYLYSYDSDREWFKENKKLAHGYHSNGSWHGVEFVEDWDLLDLDRDGTQFWSVVFVDHKPAKQRMKEVKRLAHNSMFVVIHDSEPEADKFFKYSWIYKHFKYRYDYMKLRPYTTVLSNFVDVTKLLG